MKDFGQIPQVGKEVILLEPASLTEGPDNTPELTDAEIRKATCDAGMVILDRAKIRGFAKIGKLLKREGLIEVKRGRLAGRQDNLERARKVMMELIEDRVVMMGTDNQKPVIHHEVTLAATNALVAIISTENKCDELDLELENKRGSYVPTQAPSNKLPPDEMGFEAIEINAVLK